MILDKWKGKRVKLIYSDNGQATPKEGRLMNADNLFFILETERGSEAFRTDSIIRVERSGKYGAQD